MRKNRKHRRKPDKAKGMAAIDLRPGRVLSPIPGLMHWGDDGQPLGVWGKDKPLRYLQREKGGHVRVMSEAENALAEAVYGRLMV